MKSDPLTFSPRQLRQLRTAVREEVKTIVREEVSQDLETIKQIQGSQGIMLRGIQGDVNGLKSAYRTQSTLFEDLNDQFIAVAELLSNNLDVRSEVNDHTERLTEVESTQELLRKTVTAHSLQLNNQ